MMTVSKNLEMPDLSFSNIMVAFQYFSDKWERNTVTPRDWFGLVFVTEGEIEFYFPDDTIRTKKGDILIYPKGIPYNGKRLTEMNGAYVINYDTEMTEFLQLGLPLCFHPQNENFIRDRFDELIKLWNDDQVLTNRLRCHSMFLELVAIITESYYAQKKPFINVAASNAIAYIKENFNDPSLRIDTLCEMFFISPSQLRRSIWEYRHMSPMDFLHQMRINHAKSMLMNTDQPIKNVAEQSGFTNIQYFSRLFKMTVGISPTEYRLMHINNTE